MTTATPKPSVGHSLDHVLYYDGECGLCDRSVAFVLQHDRERLFRFAALQGETASERLPTRFTANINSVVYECRGQMWTHSSAVCRVLWNLGGVWSLAGAMLWIIPAPVRDLGYRTVARFRHRLFPRKSACRMPSVDERACMLP